MLSEPTVNFAVVLPGLTEAIESAHLIFKYSLFPLSLRKLTGNGRFIDSTELHVKANPAVLGFIITTSWN